MAHRRLNALAAGLVLAFAFSVAVSPLSAEDTPQAKKTDEAVKPEIAVPDGYKKLMPDAELWINKDKGEVLVDGNVCLREGELEMFACTKNSKEHESVVAVNAKAFAVHAALLAIGAKPGVPVKFLPEFSPATGMHVDVLVQWKDKEGKLQECRAQDWILDGATKKPMNHDWVFTGSSFWKDDEGKEHYAADSGDLICVSNFPTAMMDLPIKSSASNAELLFHALTEKIPPKGTPVRLVLKPKLEKANSK